MRHVAGQVQDEVAVRRVELQLGVGPSHYEPGAHPVEQLRSAGADGAGHAPTTGARSGGSTGKTEEREALKL